MLDKLQDIESRYKDLNRELMDPAVMGDQTRYRDVAREHTQLQEIVRKYHDFKKLLKRLKEGQEMLDQEKDPELKELARMELEEVTPEKEQIEEELRVLLLPKDVDDGKDALVEIRAGTGGDEAGLFAGELFRMFTRFAERRGWKWELMSSSIQGIGGYKEVIFTVSGPDAYGTLKYESGVHRVQRVPVTETSGRIHTSAASVAVLPEAEEVDIQIDPNELRIDVFRSSGPGGQSVNTTDSAVRITHIPTGLVVSCQDEKSQHKNKAKALRVLRSRLYEQALREEEAKLAETRRTMVGSGDRSAKIRTYNFPQGRITDHRIGLTLYKLNAVLDGDLEEIIEQLRLADQAERLKMAG